MIKNPGKKNNYITNSYDLYIHIGIIKNVIQNNKLLQLIIFFFTCVNRFYFETLPNFLTLVDICFNEWFVCIEEINGIQLKLKLF